MDIETEVLKVKALRLQRGDILVVRLGAGEYIVDEQAQHLKDTVERLLAKAGIVDIPVAVLPDGVDFEVVTVLGTGRLKPPQDDAEVSP